MMDRDDDLSRGNPTLGLNEGCGVVKIKNVENEEIMFHKMSM